MKIWWSSLTHTLTHIFLFLVILLLYFYGGILSLLNHLILQTLHCTCLHWLVLFTLQMRVSHLLVMPSLGSSNDTTRELKSYSCLLTVLGIFLFVIPLSTGPLNLQCKTYKSIKLKTFLSRAGVQKL